MEAEKYQPTPIGEPLGESCFFKLFFIREDRMKKAKYQIENALTMQAGFRQLVQQVDFEDKDVVKTLKANPCHIYMICSRPKITLIRDEIKITKDKYKIAFMQHYNEKNIIREFEFPNMHNYCSFELNESRNRLSLKNKNGDIITEGKTSLIYAYCINNYEDVLDFKVLYVGQAFGDNGKRLASDRLISHNTLQKIYADAIDTNPSQEYGIIRNLGGVTRYPYNLAILNKKNFLSLTPLTKALNPLSFALKDSADAFVLRFIK